MIHNPRARPPFPRWLRWFIGTTTALAATILLLAIVLGVRAGLQQVELRNRQQVGYHLQRAIDLRAQGNLPEAINAYQQVLAIEPDNESALKASEALLALLSGLDAPLVDTSQATQGVDGGAVDSGTGSEAESKNALWSSATAAFDAGKWQEAIDALVALRQTQPDFQPDQVSSRLYNAYLALAAEKDRINDQVSALNLLDQAIALKPNEGAAQDAKRVIETYRNALTLTKTDLAKAVFTLRELYEIDSGYRDVRERLQRAHMAYADSLVRSEEWCSAVVQYNAAIDIQVTPGSISKRDKYATFCDDPSVALSVSAARTTASSPAESSTPKVAPDDAPSDARNGDSTTNVATGNRVGTIGDDEERPERTAVDNGAGDGLVTDAPDTVSAPNDLPTGRIIYSSIDPNSRRSRILSQPIEGGSPTLVIDNASQPAMRADGARLAFHNLDDAVIGLSSFDPGSGLRLRFTKFGEDNLPSWSADGNRLVFTSNREGDRLWRIYTVWAEVDGAIQNLGFGEAPAWHPSADRIAFRGCDRSGNGCGIWTMTSNGGDRRAITNVPADTRPAWTPDGKSIVFMSGARHGNSEIYRADVGSGTVTRLTEHPGNDVSPSVSPDGQWVCFLSDRDGAWKFWVVPLSGGEARLIATLEGQLGNWVDQGFQWVR